MAKKFISFLGTSAYIPCKYKLNDKVSNEVRYVQEALIDFVCKNWKEEDAILIFATEGEDGSIKENWEKAKIKFNPETKTFEYDESKGLQTILNDMSLKAKVRMIPIPDGVKEGEIWKIIEKLYDNINKKDELYIDITHSFRYIPMVITAMITFLKTTKNTDLKAIYYGAFEAKDDNYIAPIRILTELYKMIEWSEATNAFLKYGSGQRLIKQIDSIDKTEMDKKTKGIFAPLKNNISKIDDALKFNNVIELKELKNPKNSKNIDLNKNPNLFALKKLLPQIDKFTTQWSDNEVTNGLLAAQWCLDNDRFAQALTFTQEALITYFCNLFNWNAQDKDQRGAVSFIIQIAVGEKSKDEHSKKDEEWFKNSIDEILKQLSKLDQQFLEDFLKVSEWRNIINHAKKGDRTNMQDNFSNILKSFNEKINPKGQK